MSDHPQSPSTPYSDTLDAIWKKSKKKLSFLSPGSKPADDDSPEESSKSTHTRRREQVRRAQRKHRDRKEKYIRTLELELLRLRDEERAISHDTKMISEENQILRDIMLAHGITPPERQPQAISPMAIVSVIGSPGHGQRLHVSVPDHSVLCPEIFPIGFGLPGDGETTAFDLSDLSVSPVAGSSGVLQNQVAAPTQHLDLVPGIDPRNQDAACHPYGLDATQVGVDFVLLLERCCLGHARALPGSDEPSGHALTAQGPLLAGAPQILGDHVTWEIPAFELDRLFELSSALNLDGEITPVQAWIRIKEHPLFHKLDPEHLRQLCIALMEETECFGFGTVLDEEIFTSLLNQTLNSLSP